MSELLINWLNKEVILSKQITDIPSDFKNGYLFAELLYKTRQIPSLTLYKDSDKQKDIITNFCRLHKNLLDMGIILDEKNRNDIMNNGIYAAKIYLLKIKQVLDKKCINQNQIRIKESNELQKLYNQMYFKNENKKYLLNIKRKQDSERKTYSETVNSTNPITTPRNLLSKKYAIGGELYNQLKKQYAHLDLTDFDIEIILLDMKSNENKMNILKKKIQNTEKKREKYMQQKEKIWFY